MKSWEFITESQQLNSQLNAFLKAAGYQPYRHTEHFPKSERYEMRVQKLEKLIKDAGYKRTKTPNSSEYTYQYDVEGTPVVFNYRVPNTGLAGWYIADPVREDNVTKGDFGKKGGPKPQTQNAEKISMAQAFGSEGYNVLAAAGIKLHEKPSYWSDLERKPIGEVGLQKIKKLFAQAGVDLPEYDAWEIYPIAPEPMDDEEAREMEGMNTYVKYPLASVETMPLKGVFIIRNLPYYDDNTRKVKEGDFLVDSQGANKYIRFWRMIK